MTRDEIIALDRQHVWHPCTQEKDHESLPPIPISHGDGVYLVDVDGKRYLDGVSSWWVNLFGHNHPRLIAALSGQAEKISHHIFAGFTHEPAVRLAEQLCRLAPGALNKVFFTDNGSSAVEAALKMSFQFWLQSGRPRKTKFVSLSEAYHGETVGALSVGGIDLYRKIYRPILLEGFQAPGPDCYRCPYGLQRESCRAECIAPLETILAEHAAEIAGVIVEPLIQGAAGMRIYPPVYLQRLRALCDRHEVHYIADEIAVAFGRTGTMFANEHAGVAPDLMCLSKGITAGTLPLAVVLSTDTIYQAFYDDYETLKAFFHSHSYSGNPLACAVANEVLAIFEDEQVLPALAPKQALLDRHAPRFTALEHVGEFRRCGMVAAIELVADRAQRTPYPWEQRRGYRVFRHALDHGALLRPLGNVVYFMPPLSISCAELETLLDVAYEGIRLATAD